jgi:hypothetical protein
MDPPDKPGDDGAVLGLAVNSVQIRTTTLPMKSPAMAVS